MKRIVLSVIAAGAVGSGFAGEIAAQRPAYAAAVDSIMGKFGQSGPGCAVGVSRAGVGEFAKGYGLADIASGRPIAPSTVFNVGSTSKQFVTMAIQLLVDDGKLSLEDDIRKFVPEVPDFGRKVTVRHLVNHTSGIRDYATLLGLMGWNGGDQYDDDRFLSLMSAQKKLNFAPGSRFLYNNSGYILLSIIVTRASGMPWHDFAATRMFKPLGMARSEVRGDPFSVESSWALAYHPDGSSWKVDLPNHAITGSTAILTTVEDLARWAGNYWRPSVGTAATMARMHQRGVLTSGDTVSYASGLTIGRDRGRPLVQHGGSTGGFRAQFIRYPDQQVGIAVLCNASNANPDALVARIADKVLPPTTVTAAPNEWRPPAELAGTYVDRENDAVLRFEGGDDIFLRTGGGRVAVRGPAVDRIQVGGNVLSLIRSGSTITGLAGNDEGSSTRYERVPAVDPAEALDRYVGAFYSEEMDRTWWVRSKEGALWLVRRDFAPVKLTALSRGLFSASGPTLRFTESGDLRVGAGRAYGIEFRRLPNDR